MAKQDRRRGRTRYAVRNWPRYDRALARRGDMTVWISPEVVAAWRGEGRRACSDAAIAAALTVRIVFGLALRQTEGLVASLFALLGLDLPVPDHTTLSRRGRALAPDRRTDAGRGIDLAVDSTGLRLTRRSSWRRRSGTGMGRGREGWRKLHIAVDPGTGRVVAEDLTRSDVHDTQPLPEMLGRISGRLGRVYGDGAYEAEPMYRLLVERRQALPIAEGVFRPRKPAVRAAGTMDRLARRGRNVRLVAEHGRSAWERATGYRRRNAAEAAFSRIKRIFGDRLRSRGLGAQRVEAALLAHALNRMTDLGMPIAHRAG